MQPPIPVARALRQIEADPRVTNVRIITISPAETTAEIDMETALPSRWLAAGESPSGVRSAEPVTVVFGGRFPIEAPRFYLRSDFDRSHPHLQPRTDGKAEPCLVAGSPTELLRSRGISALIDQLAVWLEKAALVQLIDPQQGWEPVRRDGIDDLVVADAVKLRGLVSRESGCTALASRRATEKRRDIRLHCIAVGDEKAVIKAEIAHQLTIGNTGLAFVAWSGKQPTGAPFVAGRYSPESVSDFKTLFARAQELGCAEMLFSKLHLLSLRIVGIRFRFPIPIAVIIIARRPCNVIGVDSPLEVIPYVFEIDGTENDLSRSSAKPVRLASHRSPISPDLLRFASASRRCSGGWSLLGCGSVGSKIAVHLTRAGDAPMRVIDRAAMSPHNFARHGLLPTSVFDGALLMSKADRLQEALNSFGSEVTAEVADASRLIIGGGAPKFADDSTLLVNATGSLTIREVLSSPDVGKPRAVEACLMGGGRIAYLAAEGPVENPSSVDLVTEAYRLFRSDPEFRDVVFQSAPIEVPIGEGCSSLTFPMSDARLSALTAPMAEQISKWRESSLPEERGEILVGVTPADGLGQRWLTQAVRPFTILKQADQSSSVRISVGVQARIEAEVASKPGVETGGVLIGRWSEVTNAFHVVDLLPAPPDSVFTTNEFRLGIVGLKEALEALHSETGGALYALGTWHNHLVSSGPSSIDMRTAALLAVRQFFPVLLLIQTPGGYRYLTAEVIFKS
jgi:hypothetical protein